MKSSNHFSVDCGSAHKGLFVGIAVLAGTIVSLMLFNGLFHNEKYMELALLQVKYLYLPTDYQNKLQPPRYVAYGRHKEVSS